MCCICFRCVYFISYQIEMAKEQECLYNVISSTIVEPNMLNFQLSRTLVQMFHRFCLYCVSYLNVQNSRYLKETFD